MRWTLVFGTLIVAGIGLQATPASAKGPVEVCGVNACRQLLGTEGSPAVNVLTQGGRARMSPAAPTRYFSIRFAEMPQNPLAYWIPAASLLRVGNEQAVWVKPTPAEVVALQAKTLGMTALSAPRRFDVSVDLKPVRGDFSYLRLYTIGTPARSAGNSGGWLKILIFGRFTPWTDGVNSVWISRQGRLLRRDGEIATIPATTAERVRARLPLIDV